MGIPESEEGVEHARFGPYEYAYVKLRSPWHSGAKWSFQQVSNLDQVKELWVYHKSS